MGLGRLGGLPLRKGWAADRRALVCGVVGLSGAGIGDTPAAGGLLRLLWSWWSAGWWVPLARACVRVGVACCRGSGVVRPGCLACGSASLLWGGVVGVGGLVVNCIVDASILL